VQATGSPLRIHPGTWHSSMYISDGIYTVPPLATSTCTREKYTQGHGIPPCIYQNGLVPRLPAACATREKYTRDMAFLHVCIRMGSTVQRRLLQAACATRRNTPRDMVLHVYIRMGSTVRLLPAAGEIYTGHGIPCIYQNGIYTVQRATTTSSLCHKGEIQGHGIPPCIYQNGIYTVCTATTTSSLCHKEKYRDMAFLHVYISEWDLHGAATSYYWLVPQGRNIHPGTWHSSMYISEWDLHGAALLPAACASRNIYPGTWHSSMYIRMGSTVAATSYYQQLVPQGRNIQVGIYSMYIRIRIYRCSTATSAACTREKYTWRIPPCIYQNGICAATTSSLCHRENIHRTFLHVYNRMGSTRCSAATTSSL
jgi:hypothetical protein